MSDLRRSRYSSHSGNGQQRSPARSPASRTSASRASSFPIAPIATWPSATTTAPVSVAMSMTAAGLKRRTYESASHRIRRPSASVLMRSEEHTSELQSHHDLVCRLLLEKKKKQNHKELP